MLKFVEVSAKTEDEAVKLALAQLGVEREDATVEILERAKSGFLGIGSSPARVKVSYEYRETKVEKVEQFLAGLFEKMGVDARTEITQDGENINVVITGEDPGALIGRRGETLDAIQRLTNYSVNRGDDERVRVNIDTENYRERRDESLVHLAEKTAAKAVKFRRNMTLEPMNSYERHVIHTALQDYQGVTTYSTGTEPNRRVVVAYDRTQAPAQSKYTAREWK
ncbi:MAG: protein jag [Oscillospiraceae bacterium]|nr:protein jag [Oscillospiraceae bacterium]